MLAGTLPDLPVTLVQAALVSGVDLGVDAAALEATLLPATDAHRGGGANAVSTAVHPGSTVSVGVVADAGPGCGWGTGFGPPQAARRVR